MTLKELIYLTIVLAVVVFHIIPKMSDGVNRIEARIHGGQR